MTRIACTVSQAGETTNRVRAGSSGPNTMVTLIGPSRWIRDSADTESLALTIAAGQPWPVTASAPASATEPIPAGRARYRDVLGVAEFRAIFVANIVSMLGTVVASVALTVLVYEQTRSAALAASVMALAFLPYMLGGVLMGAAADQVGSPPGPGGPRPAQRGAGGGHGDPRDAGRRTARAPVRERPAGPGLPGCAGRIAAGRAGTRPRVHPGPVHDAPRRPVRADRRGRGGRAAADSDVPAWCARPRRGVVPRLGPAAALWPGPASRTPGRGAPR